MRIVPVKKKLFIDNITVGVLFVLKQKKVHVLLSQRSIRGFRRFLLRRIEKTKEIVESRSSITSIPQISHLLFTEYLSSFDRITDSQTCIYNINYDGFVCFVP